MSMWNIDNVGNEKIITPRDILQEQCEELARLTGNKIIARVAEYKGEYVNRTSKVLTESLNALSNVFQSYDTGFDVQSVLGENGSDSEDTFVYELYITSEKTPKYKYRAFIMHYGIGIYPVSIVLAKDIADELGCENEYVSDVYENDFIGLLQKILGSLTVTSVVRKLMQFNR